MEQKAHGYSQFCLCIIVYHITSHDLYTTTSRVTLTLTIAITPIMYKLLNQQMFSLFIRDIWICTYIIPL